MGSTRSEALPDLETRLSALPDDAVQKPYTDPHGAAVTALLVADWLEVTKADGALSAELASLARAMLRAVR